MKRNTWHNIVTTILWLAFAVNLGRLLLVLNGLPDRIGVHFASDGSFDIYDSKYYSFYPHIVSFVCLLLFDIFIILSRKMTIGKKVKKTGENLIRKATIVFIDISKILFCLFFSVIWNDCVIRQHALNTIYPIIILIAFFGSFIIFLVAIVFIIIKYRSDEKSW